MLSGTDMKITPRVHGFLPLLMLLMLLLGFIGTPAWAVTTTASDSFAAAQRFLDEHWDAEAVPVA